MGKKTNEKYDKLGPFLEHMREHYLRGRSHSINSGKTWVTIVTHLPSGEHKVITVPKEDSDETAN